MFAPVYRGETVQAFITLFTARQGGNSPWQGTSLRPMPHKWGIGFFIHINIYMKKKNHNINEHHESDYSFMRRCAHKLNIPWQEIASNEVYVDLIREARYNGMSTAETINYFKEILSEKKDIFKKTIVKTPGQTMDISKRSKDFPTPPCEMDK